jgi:hypothetical protein
LFKPKESGGMSEDVLLELEPSSAVTESLENVDLMVRNVALALEGMKGSACAWENAWRTIIIRDVARGQTAEMHAARPRLVRSLEKRLSLVKHTHLLAQWLRELGRADSPDPDVLLPEIAGLERLKANVFDRWQTAEDLEDLAARDYPLTNADLDQIGPQRQPPASYYAEESKPF